MPVKKKPGNQRILSYLQDGNELTKAVARSRFGIQNLSACIAKFRAKGFAIYLNDRTTTKGRTYKAYRLGAARRAVVAAGYDALRSSASL